MAPGVHVLGWWSLLNQRRRLSLAIGAVRMVLVLRGFVRFLHRSEQRGLLSLGKGLLKGEERKDDCIIPLMLVWTEAETNQTATNE
jgi:hypothetical protein